MARSCDQIDSSTSMQRLEAAVTAIRQSSTLHLQEALTQTSSHVFHSVDNEGVHRIFPELLCYRTATVGTKICSSKPRLAGRSILHWAVMVGSEGILQMVLEYISLNSQCRRPSSQTAAAPKQDELLWLMLAPDKTLNKSPFGMAILAGAAMKVFLLVKHEPLATVWTAHQSDACAVQIASSMLKGPKKCRAREV